MKDCIFCKIIKKEVPAEIVYEDDNSLAFMDILPTIDGHVLVLPKAHTRNIFDISNEDAQTVALAVKKVAKAVRDGVNAEGVNIIVNNEPAAGQVVFHSHTHVIPRFAGDGLEIWPQHKYKEGEIEKFGQKIRNAF